MSEISVIVPVYKAEPYLHRCIDSILVQTFSDFDVILVDDGSPDDCPNICDEYVIKDPRIHVIHQKNSGPSAARNNGIDWAFQHSDSSYLTFVDSDDCVHPQYLERLYNAVINSDTEVSMCRHKYISFDESLEKITLHGEYQANIVSAEDLMITEWSSFNYAWGKLYAKKCFQELRYPVNVSFGEDNLIVFKVMFESNKIVFVNDDLYYYFYNAAGITKSPWTPRSLEVFEGIRAQLNYYAANGYERAYQKEIELYIQQYAYQIHRIREDKANFAMNRHYLVEMQKQMKELLRENEAYEVSKNIYWYEVLYPGRTMILHMFGRIKRNLKENGVNGTLKKIAKKLF